MWMTEWMTNNGGNRNRMAKRKNPATEGESGPSTLPIKPTTKVENERFRKGTPGPQAA